jgi:hypothetical protein
MSIDVSESSGLILRSQHQVDIHQNIGSQFRNRLLATELATVLSVFASGCGDEGINPVPLGGQGSEIPDAGTKPDPFDNWNGGAGLWGMSFGDVDPNQRITDITTPPTKNSIYATGYMAGKINFNSADTFDNLKVRAFIVEFTHSGAHKWSKQLPDGGSFISTGFYSRGVAIKADSQGNVIVAGNFFGNMDLGGGPLLSADQKFPTTFLAKFDPDGNHLWSKAFVGNLGQTPTHIALDQDDNIVMAGIFLGDIDLGNGKLQNTDQPAFPGDPTTSDFYIAKFNSNGSTLWSGSYGNPEGQFPKGVNTDSEGNVVFALQSWGGDLDFGGPAFTAPTGVHSGYITMLDPDGNYRWSKPLGSESLEIATITVDPENNILIGGDVNGQVSFDGHIIAKKQGPFLLKLRTDGTQVWNRVFNDYPYNYNLSNVVFNDLVADSQSIVITGTFKHFINLEGPDRKGQQSAGGNDFFIAKLNTEGEFRWIRRVGDNFNQVVYTDNPRESHIHVAVNGQQLFVGGSFQNMANFDGFQMSVGGEDMFLAKLVP